jgi:branched-subunit amino acid aminotransferase/4-amino-4-deoxychorismate lyase
MNNITLDECFQFGLGAFETIGIEKGTPILLEKHLKRLERAADFLKLGDPAVRGSTAGRIEEYLEGDNPVFVGKRVHIGTDEYSGTLCAEAYAYKGKCSVFSSCQSLYAGEL